MQYIKGLTKKDKIYILIGGNVRTLLLALDTSLHEDASFDGHTVLHGWICSGG